MNNKENFMRGIIYEAVSRILPTPGRDFNIKITFNNEKSASIDIEGLTTVGKAVRSALLLQLNSEINSVMEEKEAQYAKRKHNSIPEDDTIIIPGVT